MKIGKDHASNRTEKKMEKMCIAISPDWLLNLRCSGRKARGEARRQIHTCTEGAGGFNLAEKVIL